MLGQTSPIKSQVKNRFRYFPDAVCALSMATLLFIQSWYGNLYNVRFGYFSKLPVTCAKCASWPTR